MSWVLVAGCASSGGEPPPGVRAEPAVWSDATGFTWEGPPPSASPPPPRFAVLHVPELVPGATVTVSVLGPPDADVTLLYGTGGIGAGPCHPTLPVCADLVGARKYRTLKADPTGLAEADITVPLGLPPVFWGQAFVLDPVSGEGEVSNVVERVLTAAAEVCDDGLDTDLDGLVDCDDPDCSWACAEVCSGGADDDADGLVDCDDPECFEEPACQPAAPAVSPHNVLLVVLDDVGFDKLAAYTAGPEVPPTPALDTLFDEGVRFDNAYAYPVCSPTRAAMLTGRYGRRTGFGTAGPLDLGFELDLAETTLPEMLDLSATAWDNAMVGKWHVGSVPGRSAWDHPNLQGFRHYAGSYGNLDQEHPVTAGADDYFSWQKTEDGVTSRSTVYATTDTVDDALAELGVLQEPWLLVVSFNGAHAPVHDPPSSLTPVGDVIHGNGPTDPELYAEVVEAVDTELGRLLAAVDPATTTTILFSDNGSPDFALLPPLTEGMAKRSPYEAGIRVPFVVHGPLVPVGGGVSDALVHVVDIFPTVAAIAGYDPAPHGIDGLSLLPQVVDPATRSRRRYVYTEYFQHNGPPPYDAGFRVLRDERYKYVVPEGPDGYGTKAGPTLTSTAPMFFDLTLDPPFDGPNLLEGPLSAEQSAALLRLAQELELRVAAMGYEGP